MKFTNSIYPNIILTIVLLNVFNGVFSKAIISIRIFNYKNHYDIKHDGNKCEVLHWINDYCDPIFDICVSTKNRCDILNKKIDHWKNKKTLYTVLNQNIELQKVQRKYSVSVIITDHDKFDVHDFIGQFTAEFHLENLNQAYRQSMKLNGRKRNINLEASLMIKCAKGYFGSGCEANINECQNNCVGGNCLFNKEKETFVCQCKQGWYGIHCKAFKTNNCKLLNCKLECNKLDNINHCFCIDKPFSMSCQEVVKNNFPPEKIITTQIQYPSTMETTFNTATYSKISTSISTKISSKISTKISTKLSLLTDTQTEIKKISDFIITEKPNLSNQTSKFPGSLKFSENMKESNPNLIQSNSNTVFHAPSTIIIISLLLLLCICIISLLIIVRNMQKSKTNLTKQFPLNRPLPPILFKRNILPNESFKSHTQDSNRNMQSNAFYETCTIQNPQCSNKSINISKSNYMIDNTDPYEEPIINNMESLTCETDFNYSDDSDTYEIPIKSNKSTNF